MSSPETAALEFIQNAIGQIVAMVATIIAAAKWIDKQNQKKVDNVRKCIMDEVNDKEAKWKADFEGMRRDIRNIKLQEETIRGYIERDIARIDRNVERLSSRAGVDSERNGEHSYANKPPNYRYRGIGGKRDDDSSNGDNEGNGDSTK